MVLFVLLRAYDESDLLVVKVAQLKLIKRVLENMEFGEFVREIPAANRPKDFRIAFGRIPYTYIYVYIPIRIYTYMNGI